MLSLKKKKENQEGGNKKYDDFDMEILKDGDLETALNVENNTSYGKQPQKNI